MCGACVRTFCEVNENVCVYVCVCVCVCMCVCECVCVCVTRECVHPFLLF